jgi:RNA polymerase sigma-70 factor (ECF subfamily)
MLQEQDDEALMQLVAAGHRLAFDHLVRRHLSHACAIAARVGGSVGEAEDIAQEAFIKIWVAAPSWQPGRAKFGTWLYRIVVNVSIDRYRARRKTGPADWDQFADPDADPSRRAASAEEMRVIADAVARLPEKQRVAILLCYRQDRTNAQAAAIMGIHIKSLEGLLTRARKSLKTELKDFAEDTHHDSR